ncbi:MAG TPA: hypothetical protein VN224_13040 [Xanthomonadales bacterium]|nr:hypothetical protein [Xanthomonadales bacterium]
MYRVVLVFVFAFAVFASQMIPAISAAGQASKLDPQCTLDNVETSYQFMKRVRVEAQLKPASGVAGSKVKPNVADAVYQRTWTRFQKCPLAPKSDCSDADVTKPNDEADYRNASNGIQRREDAYDVLYDAFHSCVVNTLATVSAGSAATPIPTPLPNPAVSSGCKTAQTVGTALGVGGLLLPAFKLPGKVTTPISAVGGVTALLSANCANKQQNADVVTPSSSSPPSPAPSPSATKATVRT